MISVIIPVLNGATELPDQLHALLAQDYLGDWELLVADNGSTDGTRAVIDSWARETPRVRIVDASARPGPSAARNIAVPEARGESIAFVDHDDIVAPGWLSTMALALAENTVVAGPTCYSFQDGDGTDTSVVPVGECPIPEWGGFLPGYQTGNLGMRREVFLEAGGFDESLHICEDFDFCWRVQLSGHTIAFHSEMHIWRRRRGTAGAQLRQGFSYGVAQVQLYRKFKKFGLRPEWGWCGRQYLWLVTRIPFVFSPRVRRAWIRVAGRRAGRLWGSFKMRTLYP